MNWLWSLSWLWVVVCAGLALTAPGAYGVACVVVSGASVVTLGTPGMITSVGRSDPSGKGHRTLVPIGCLPVTLAADLATAPMQLPLIGPLAYQSLRGTAEKMRIGLSMYSPEAIRGLLDSVEQGDAKPWQHTALEEVCHLEGALAPEELTRVIAYFCGRGYPRPASPRWSRWSSTSTWRPKTSGTSSPGRSGAPATTATAACWGCSRGTPRHPPIWCSRRAPSRRATSERSVVGRGGAP